MTALDTPAADAAADLHTYRCDDGNAAVDIEASSAREAAQEYVDSGDWGDDASTQWVTVYVTTPCEHGEYDAHGEDCDGGTREAHGITLDPTEPDCTADAHDWQSPYEIVGGIRENPGCWGHGGGVIYTEVCVHCGCARVTDTWAQDPSDGTRGLTSVSYEPERYTEELAARADETAAADD